jgi:phenylalanyl-tRNA synthetase beta chain
MRIASHLLRQYIDIPQDPRKLRDLLDDVGIEVKRVESDDEGDLFTVELLANRGDHHCYHGIAREICGRTGGEIRLPQTAKLTEGVPPVALRNETDQCLVYTGTLLERVGPDHALPADQIAPLLAADLHSVSAPVDATNLSNLEFGQPTHAFDADTIAGAIIIRLSRPGETAWPLFQEERVALPEGTLVIADEEKILAIAGVIGCEESKATETTTRLLLESATFDPVAVRRASRSLGIATDSSARFERGSDPNAALVGAGRVVHLLETHAGWKRAGATGVVGSWTDPHRVIALNIPDAAAFLEYPLTEEEVCQRLVRYGFAVSGCYPEWDPEEGWRMPPELEEWSRERLRNTVLVRVPPHRLWDVEFVADLYEELAKSVGYNETPAYTPQVDMGAVPSPAEQVKQRVESLLVGHGFYEVFTDGFYGRDMRHRAGIQEGHPLWAHVETQNALERSYALLKNNSLLQATETVATNLRMRHEQVKAYEWTRSFHPDPDAPNGVCSERRHLWAVACGLDRAPSWVGLARPADALFLKGVLEEISVELGLDLVLGAPDPTVPLYTLLHPNRQGTITLGGEVVGMLGEVHPVVVQAFRIRRARPCYLEISNAALETAGARPEFREPSEHHPILRNLAFTLPGQMQAGEVAALIAASGPPFLKQVDITDLFEHEEGGRPVRTVTFALVYTSDDAPRTAEEVNRASEYLIETVEAKFGDQGVKLRQ